jgi:hypothetical protein
VHADDHSGVGPKTVGSDRLAHRMGELYRTDQQFAAARPLPEVLDAARDPDLRLSEILQTLIGGYGDRPAPSCFSSLDGPPNIAPEVAEI